MSRLPTSEDHRLYLAQDVAAQQLSTGVPATDIAAELRRRYALSPIATIKALRKAGVPLVDG
jgi:hypothetical protein